MVQDQCLTDYMSGIFDVSDAQKDIAATHDLQPALTEIDICTIVRR